MGYMAGGRLKVLGLSRPNCTINPALDRWGDHHKYRTTNIESPSSQPTKREFSIAVPWTYAVAIT